MSTKTEMEVIGSKMPTTEQPILLKDTRGNFYLCIRIPPPQKRKPTILTRKQQHHKKEYFKKWSKANLKQRREYKRNWQRKNPTKVKQYHKQYYDKHIKKQH